MKLSEIILEKHNMSYDDEIASLCFHEDLLIRKLEKNKLLKSDRELLIEALQIIRLGEY
jgi:hypothetical protein